MYYSIATAQSMQMKIVRVHPYILEPLDMLQGKTSSHNKLSLHEPCLQQLLQESFHGQRCIDKI